MNSSIFILYDRRMTASYFSRSNGNGCANIKNRSQAKPDL
jgi:hypothetical protein